MTPRPVARREARLSRAVAAAAGAGARAHADRVLAIAAEVHARGYAVVPILAGARLERLMVNELVSFYAGLGMSGPHFLKQLLMGVAVVWGSA